ncbi:LamG domain-containing protein [Acinetobacter junii]|uniref:LamG domain-containing protein n=1 Tax=Acinetobacter junii TaxID=40215 RepID=UPI0012507BDE|nr:LamG domain-containing protein [Acinetobacter junii]
MAIIDYTYKVDGFFNTINYYRSTTPLNVGAMPPPVATGITELSYSDTTAASDADYYVRFGSVKAGIEKLSSQISVSTRGIVEYADTYLNLFADVIDRGLKPKTFTATSITYSANFAVFNGTSSYISTPAHADFGFGTGDMTVECAIKSTSTVSRCLIDFRDGTNGNVSLWYDKDGVYWLDHLTFEKTSVVTINDGNVHHIAVVRWGGLLKVYIDGVSRFSKNSSQNYGTSRQVNIGRAHNGTGYFDGSIRKVRITKGVAVYKANFTITYQI